jgi:hypothetical protein
MAARNPQRRHFTSTVYGLGPTQSMRLAIAASVWHPPDRLLPSDEPAGRKLAFVVFVATLVLGLAALLVS